MPIYCRIYPCRACSSSSTHLSRSTRRRPYRGQGPGAQVSKLVEEGFAMVDIRDQIQVDRARLIDAVVRLFLPGSCSTASPV